MTQLSLALDDLPLNPLTCQHATNERVDNHTFCSLHSAWVDCQVGHFGEPPMCAYEEPDNSEGAIDARLAWLRRREDK